MYKLILSIFLIPCCLAVSGQTDNNLRYSGADFLTIAPNARAGAMGSIGVATAPDVYSLYWNAAKTVFNESTMEVAYTYSPWMREIIKDINLSALSFYRKIDDVQAISLGFRYFSFGEITFSDENGAGTGSQNPYEMSIDLAYSRRLGKHLSAAVTLKYLRSQLGAGQQVSGIQLEAANAVAADLSVFYQRETRIAGKASTYRIGLSLSDIGSKLKYGDNLAESYLPGSLRLGASLETRFSSNHSLMLSAEANSLMIPRIEEGKTSDKSGVGGYFSAFGDIRADNLFAGVGAEYWYAGTLALRAGYHYGNDNSGRPSYFSTGLGVRYFNIIFDFSYIAAISDNNPLRNSLQFTAGLNLDFFRKK